MNRTNSAARCAIVSAAVLMAAMPAAAQTGKPVPGELQTYKDWTIGCDNVGMCETTSLLPEDRFPDGATVAIAVTRDAGPMAQPRVHVRASEDMNGMISLAVDGRTMASMAARGDALVIEGPQASALTLAMARGSKLEVRQGKKVLGTPSLAGSAAALRYMDARQGRAGTVTALVATGPLQARAVKAAVAMPVVRRAIVPAEGKIPPLWAAERASANKASRCDDEFDRDREPEMFALSKTQALVLVPCGAGAYNFSSGVLIASGSPGRRTFAPARFDLTPGWGEENGLPVVVNAGWEAKTSTLTSYAKGRGIGDCGAAQSWAWDGAMFRLVEASSMGECRGAWNWITTWRARVTP